VAGNGKAGFQNELSAKDLWIQLEELPTEMAASMGDFWQERRESDRRFHLVHESRIVAKRRA